MLSPGFPCDIDGKYRPRIYVHQTPYYCYINIIVIQHHVRDQRGSLVSGGTAVGSGKETWYRHDQPGVWPDGNGETAPRPRPRPPLACLHLEYGIVVPDVSRNWADPCFRRPSSDRWRSRSHVSLSKQAHVWGDPLNQWLFIISITHVTKLDSGLQRIWKLC